MGTPTLFLIINSSSCFIYNIICNSEGFWETRGSVWVFTNLRDELVSA